MKMSTNVLGSDSPLSSNHASERSIDAGTLELGVKSAWTWDETFVTVAERSGSLRVEPSMSDQLSAVTAEGALGAPPNPSMPLTNVNEVVHAEDYLDAGVSPNGSTPMIIALLLGSADGQTRSLLFSTENNQNENNIYHSPSTSHLSNIVSWADSPDDGEIGEVPEFPVLEPIRGLPSITSMPRIPSELKGKGVEQCEKKTPAAELNPKDWLDQWTKEDESLAGAARPGPDDPDASLGEIWDDDNRCRSLQYQNLYLQIQCQKAKSDKNEHESQVLELRDRVRELEMLVIQSQEHELEARNRVCDAHSSETVSTQAPVGPSGEPPLRKTNTSPRIKVTQPPQTVTDSESPPPSAMSTKPPANLVRVSVTAQRASIAPPTVSNQYQCTSLVLAPNSSVRRAILGLSPVIPDHNNPLSDLSSDDEESSTESDPVTLKVS
jgi:hypothetical protein